MARWFSTLRNKVLHGLGLREQWINASFGKCNVNSPWMVTMLRMLTACRHANRENIQPTRYVTQPHNPASAWLVPATAHACSEVCMLSCPMHWLYLHTTALHIEPRTLGPAQHASKPPCTCSLAPVSPRLAPRTISAEEP